MASEIRIYGTQILLSKLLANGDDGLHPTLESKHTIARTNFRKEKDTEKIAALIPCFIKNMNMSNIFQSISLTLFHLCDLRWL